MPSERVVRHPLRARDIPRRTLADRLVLRLPWLSGAVGRLIARLTPGSRLRRAALGRAIETSIAAYNRRDLEVTALGFDPDVEYHPYREFVEAGLAEPCYHGRAGYREYIEATYDVWGSDVRIELRELIDLGDRVVVLADMPMRAQASGVALAETYGSVWTMKHGRVARVDDFLRHEEALRAAGLAA